MCETDTEKARFDALWREALGGNQDAAAQLLGSLVPMFQMLAAHLSPWLGVDAEDLVQEAAVAVWQNLYRYDPLRGASFKTWALTVGKPAMKRNGRIPAYSRGILRQALRVETELAQELGRVPTTPEVALRADLSEEKIRNARACLSAAWPLSLDSMLDDNPGGESPPENGGPTKTPQALVAEANPMNRDELETLLQAIEKLSAQSQRAVAWFYFHGCSHAEVAAALGVSEENSRQIISRAVRKLAELLPDRL